MLDVLTNVVALLGAVWHLVISILQLIIPWTPLVAWLAFWLYAAGRGEAAEKSWRKGDGLAWSRSVS
ncbi:MAG: hypothetical protein U0872_09815 [Planctomycetaceae bacterium]